MIGTPHTGDSGTSIQLTIRDRESGGVVDLTTFSTGVFTFRHDDGTSFDVPCGLLNDGSDGVLEYVSTATTFPKAGRWRVQPTYTLSTGTWTGDWDTYTVKPRLTEL